MRPKAEILAEVRHAAATGRREVQLLGQIVNHYEAPDDEACDFAGLLEAVATVDGIDRIRFASPHPRHVTDRLIAAIRDIPQVCKHLHLPVQSGSTRRPSRDAPPVHPRVIPRHRRSCARRRAGIALSTDMIVGFPGETTSQFEGDAVADRTRPIPQHVLVQVLRDGPTRSRRSGSKTTCRKRRRRADRRASAAPARHSDRAARIGEHLASRWKSGAAPGWTNQPERFFDRPWFMGHERMKGFLLAESPLAFRRRFVFTEAEPLRRASMPRDGRWWAYETIRTGMTPTAEEQAELDPGIGRRPCRARVW